MNGVCLQLRLSANLLKLKKKTNDIAETKLLFRLISQKQNISDPLLNLLFLVRLWNCALVTEA